MPFIYPKRKKSHGMRLGDLGGHSRNTQSVCQERPTHLSGSGVQILSRSLDLTPCDFFLWVYVKGLVCVLPLPREVDDLKTRITEALATIDNAMLGRVWQELDYHLDVCRVTRTAHIEHLQKPA